MIRKSSDDEFKGCKKHRSRTHLIHGAPRSQKWDYNHHVVPPITSSATFRLDNVARGAQGFGEFGHFANTAAPHDPIYIYDRLDEPTRGMLEENLARAEGGDFGLCFASGMGAISAAICTLASAGDHVVAHDVLYGCTYSLLTNWLPRNKVDVSSINVNDLETLRKTITPATRVVYFETPVNPDLTLIDIEAVVQVVAQANVKRPDKEKVRVVVDNTFATPFCQRPIEWGADVVCMSLTKGIGGFGTNIGGAVVGPDWLYDSLILYRKDFGGSLAPMSAWHTLVYGLPSLAVRMASYQESALQVAEFLKSHPKIAEVHYPGMESFPQHELAKKQMRDENGKFAPGCMIYFVLKDPDESGEPARRLVDWVAENGYSITLAVSLGQIKTLIECPYSMTHSMIPDAAKKLHHLEPGGCRISVGLEDWHDIIADLEEGLQHA